MKLTNSPLKNSAHRAVQHVSTKTGKRIFVRTKEEIESYIERIDIQIDGDNKYLEELLEHKRHLQFALEDTLQQLQDYSKRIACLMSERRAFKITLGKRNPPPDVAVQRTVSENTQDD